MTEPKSSVKNLYRYPVPQEGRYDKLRLDKNENTAGLAPALIQELLAGITPDFLAAYPEPYTLYQKLAKSHGVEPESVIVTAGSEMAIRYLFEAYLNPGDGILLLNPSFAMFEVYAKLIGARIETIDYNEQFAVSAASVIDRIKPGIKIVAIANPNNPTGTVFSTDELKKILDAAAKIDAIVLVDEAYYYFHKETMAPHCNRIPNLVVTRTFSKACGMAGVRLGYALGTPEVISQIKKLQPIDHVSNFAVRIGEFILDHENLIWDYAADVDRAKAFLLKELPALGLSCRGSHANFILVDFGKKLEEWVGKLKERGMLVSSALRLPFPSTYVRVTVGPVNQMQKFAYALKEII